MAKKTEADELQEEGIIEAEEPPMHEPQEAPATAEEATTQQTITTEGVSDDQFEELTGKWKYEKWPEKPTVYLLTEFAFKNVKTQQWELTIVQPPGFNSPTWQADVLEINGERCADPSGRPCAHKICISSKAHIEQMKPIVNKAIAAGQETILVKVSRKQEGGEQGDWKYTTEDMNP